MTGVGLGEAILGEDTGEGLSVGVGLILGAGVGEILGVLAVIPSTAESLAVEMGNP